MPETDPSLRDLKLGFAFISLGLLIGLAGSAWIVTTSIAPLFSGNDVLLWEKWGPLVLLMSVALGALWLRFAILLRRSTNGTDDLLRPTYKFDQAVIVIAAILGIAAPFIVQPVIDSVVMPALGYDYCEPLTKRQSTFGFQTYAYVNDMSLCVPPG